METARNRRFQTVGGQGRGVFIKLTIIVRYVELTAARKPTVVAYKRGGTVLLATDTVVGNKGPSAMPVITRAVHK